MPSFGAAGAGAAAADVDGPREHPTVTSRPNTANHVRIGDLLLYFALGPHPQRYHRSLTLAALFRNAWPLGTRLCAGAPPPAPAHLGRDSAGLFYRADGSACDGFATSSAYALQRPSRSSSFVTADLAAMACQNRSRPIV